MSLLSSQIRSENKLQIRGPSFKIMHADLYGPAAFQCGLMLSLKAWMSCMKEGLHASAGFHPGCDADTLKCGRTARHSKFPECNECQQRREAYLKAARNSRSEPAVVTKLYQRVVDHTNEWQADRALAQKLRYACYLSDADAIYEGDDKCGSFWQCIPVDINGRVSKENSKRLFHFAVQANVVCGEGQCLALGFRPRLGLGFDGCRLCMVVVLIVIVVVTVVVAVMLVV